MVTSEATGEINRPAKKIFKPTKTFSTKTLEQDLLLSDVILLSFQILKEILIDVNLCESSSEFKPKFVLYKNGSILNASKINFIALVKQHSKAL